MLAPTKPFKDTVTNYPDEPSLRIGRAVPKNAVNLAYYYNPTATGSEKVLTAEAPRKTIDHKVEDTYRYLFDQLEADDSMFPTTIYYEDNEGYSGRLGRMWVKWHDESHVKTKSVRRDNVVIVANKNDVPKTLEYTGGDFAGTLFFDSADYTVTKTEMKPISQNIKQDVKNFEIIYKKVTGNYVNSIALDAWMQSSKWPSYITVGPNMLSTDSGDDIIKNYINSKESTFDGYTGILSFDKIEYEPVTVSAPVKGVSTLELALGAYKYTSTSWDDYITMPDFDTLSSDAAAADARVAELEQQKKDRLAEIKTEAGNVFKEKYLAEYDRVTDTYDYTAINDFINNNLLSGRSMSPQAQVNNAVTKLRDVMDARGDITIIRKSLNINIITDTSSGTTTYKVQAEATYEYSVTTRPVTGTIAYNVVAIYRGELEKTILSDSKEVATEYSALCHYSGIARAVTHSYDGQAYYRGSVTKGNSISSIVNTELDNEMLMYSDDTGLLRRPITVYNTDGSTRVKDEYFVEGEYFYITKIFKDGIPCFYKYDLKEYVYDYKGPDANGYYDGNSVSVRSSAFKDIPEQYKYRLMLTPINDSEGRCVKYNASLYTSFLSQATDTFKVTYNAFTDGLNGTGEVKPGVTEDIYGYPYMYQNIDYTVVPVETESRTNMIRLSEPYYIEDTRNYVTFEYKLYAHADAVYNGNELIREEINYESHTRTASILNKEYAAYSEYNKFDDRAYIISDKEDGVYLSPADIIFRDMAKDSITMNNVSRNDNTILYTAEIISVLNQDNIGGINLKCSPDGSGLLTAETTIDTGFWDDRSHGYTGKLSIDAPYLFSGNKIYPAVKVKFVDSRNIFVKPPRNDGLLESWYPLIQFGHYSQEFNQNGSKTKISYAMPEYDDQHYSAKWQKPYVDIYKENVEILNPHTLKTKCYPLLVYKYDISDDPDIRFYNGYAFKLFKETKTYNQAMDECIAIGGTIAMPKDNGTNEFLHDMISKSGLAGAWVGCAYDTTKEKSEWCDGTTVTYTNYNSDGPSDSSKKYAVMDASDGKWYASTAHSSTSCNGFICQIPMASTTIKLYKKLNDELFSIGIKDISYKDGIIITEDTISENDNIIADYVYVEENYVYRGYWRDNSDFARIDLNPNIYHTYNDMRYTPSVVKPSKNLFNSVIYFFLKPSLQSEQSEPPQVNDNEIIDTALDPSTGKLAYKITSTTYVPRQETYQDTEIYYVDTYGEEPVYKTVYAYDYSDIQSNPAMLTKAQIQETINAATPVYMPHKYSNISEMCSYKNTSSNAQKQFSTNENGTLNIALSKTEENTECFVSKNKYGAFSLRFTICSNDMVDEHYYRGTAIYLYHPDLEDNFNNTQSPHKQRIGDNFSHIRIDIDPPYGKFVDGISDTYKYDNTKLYYTDCLYTAEEYNGHNGQYYWDKSGFDAIDEANFFFGTYPTNQKTTVSIDFDGGCVAKTVVRDHTQVEGEYTIGTDGLKTKKANNVNLRNIKGITLFVLKLPDSIKVWVAYDNDTAWIDGHIPNTEPTIEVTLTDEWIESRYSQGKQDYIKDDIRKKLETNNNIVITSAQRSSYHDYDKQTISYKGIVFSNLGTIEKKPTQVVDYYRQIVVGQEPKEREVTKYRTVYDRVDNVRYVPIISTAVLRNKICLYHQIDNHIPQSDMDLYIGSVYIRQNTSLHSTVIVDSRTRGGGVLTSISDGLRHELEPESDFYLDIGYYDGKPYQENGVIIVKLDRKLLKDFGGHFTYSDIETKVHRWLGYGVFPIIEYVDAYEQDNLPQNTLEVDDAYANMSDIIPEIYLECIDI